ncbi:MAG: TlpA family protein disulfide reductase [Rhodocyclaceae bacterium]|nr:TlpA family protein disulfide reductase [Rhodocyclaceae bacterium]
MAGTLLLTSPAVQADSPSVTSLPALTLKETGEGPSSLAEWAAEGPIVLNVWATWCGPCRKEMPSLQRLSALLAPHGVRVVALSVDDDINLMREFLLKYDISLPTPVASSASDVYRELKAFALPFTLYIARGGQVLGQHTGAREWDQDEVVHELAGLLGRDAPR